MVESLENFKTVLNQKIQQTANTIKSSESMILPIRHPIMHNLHIYTQKSKNYAKKPPAWSRSPLLAHWA